MAKSTKPKQPKPTKPKQATKTVPISARLMAADDGGGGTPATPSIDTPLANSFAPPGIDLTINISTNRGDLRYVVEFADTSPPPGTIVMNSPPPGTGGITAIVAGANLTANRVYRIFVGVKPDDGATPPHFDHSINIHTTQPPGGVVIGPGGGPE